MADEKLDEESLKAWVEYFKLLAKIDASNK
jgi:hypothetical protein